MLRNILILLLLPLLAVTFYSFYNIFLIATREELDIAQLLLALGFTFILFMLAMRYTQTLVTRKISENLKADPSMNAFRWIMLLIGLPAVIVPGYFVFTSFRFHNKSELLERLGKDQRSVSFDGDPMFVVALIGGICFVTFGILYPIYVRQLARNSIRE